MCHTCELLSTLRKTCVQYYLTFYRIIKCSRFYNVGDYDYVKPAVRPGSFLIKRRNLFSSGIRTHTGSDPRTGWKRKKLIYDMLCYVSICACYKDEVRCVICVCGRHDGESRVRDKLAPF